MEKQLTDFQKRMLSTMGRGCGIGAGRDSITAKERRELDALVEMGLARKCGNYRGDTTGMYVKVEPAAKPTP